MMKNKLSIIVPCYNESESIPLLFSKLSILKEKADFPFEFIFVDDGSTDNTSEILKKFFPDSKIERHPTNLNLGTAVRTGMKFVTGEYTAVIDSDCSYDPILLLEMYHKLGAEVDVVDASAHHPDAGFSANTPAYRVFLSRSVVTIYNFLMKRKEFCFTSMFRMYKTPLLKSIIIENNNFLSMTEIKIKLLMKGAKFLEIAAKNNFRQYGQSKMKVVKNIIEHLKFMAKILFGFVKP